MRRATLLVLEHHRDLREALVDALLDDGYVVKPVPSSAAGLLAIRNAGEDERPDAVVVDALDGAELVSAIRADPRLAGMAVVSLRFPFDPRVDSDLDVRRPFRLDDLLGAVRAALEGRGRAAREFKPAEHPRG